MNQRGITPFSRYQKFVLLGLCGLLFTVVLDFMLLPALSSTLLEKLSLTTQQFGLVASAYAFSAGVSALITSGVADRFDRKKYLVFFSVGFLAGILICATSGTYISLLTGRILTGIFGGVIASIAYAIITDLFLTDQRGRAMGILQIAFASSLVVGLPLALLISSGFSWQWSYVLIFLIGIGFVLLLLFNLQPINAHIAPHRSRYWQHLFSTFSKSQHLLVYANNTAIVFGDVLFMTFFSAYCTHNLGVEESQLPLFYGTGGILTLVAGPLVGRLSDRIGHVKVFFTGSVTTMAMILSYTQLGIGTLWQLLVIHGILFTGITTRMVTSTALATHVPSREKRGAFMALDASIQQLAAGGAAMLAGWVVLESVDGILENIDKIGWMVCCAVLISMFLMTRIQKVVYKPI